MKRFLYLISLFFLASCSKEEAEPVKPGFLEQFVMRDPQIKIEKTTASSFLYEEAATYRGYLFKPLSDIRITAVGGRIAEKGTYRIEIYGGNVFFSETDPLLAESIHITDTEKFQYTNLTKGLALEANQLYLIRYFNESHNSVFDMVIPNTYRADTFGVFPLKIDDIAIESNYYTYHYKHNGVYQIGSGGTFTYNMLRGMVDFKYELTN